MSSLNIVGQEINFSQILLSIDEIRDSEDLLDKLIDFLNESTRDVDVGICNAEIKSEEGLEIGKFIDGGDLFRRPSLGHILIIYWYFYDSTEYVIEAEIENGVIDFIQKKMGKEFVVVGASQDGIELLMDNLRSDDWIENCITFIASDKKYDNQIPKFTDVPIIGDGQCLSRDESETLEIIADEFYSSLSDLFVKHDKKQ